MEQNKTKVMVLVMGGEQIIGHLGTAHHILELFITLHSWLVDSSYDWVGFAHRLAQSFLLKSFIDNGLSFFPRCVRVGRHTDSGVFFERF